MEREPGEATAAGRLSGGSSVSFPGLAQTLLVLDFRFSAARGRARIQGRSKCCIKPKSCD